MHTHNDTGILSRNWIKLNSDGLARVWIKELKDSVAPLPNPGAGRGAFDLLHKASCQNALESGIPERLEQVWRISAWPSQLSPLDVPVFSFEEKRARPARQATEANIANCDNLLLSER
ncbi:MAG: hypothetical protein AAGA12_11125 [Pseudomonadota bacterium]